MMFSLCYPASPNQLLHRHPADPVRGVPSAVPELSALTLTVAVRALKMSLRVFLSSSPELCV